jgi:hypothetical protein
MAERITATPGPPLAGSIEEVHGRFDSEAAVEQVIGQLRSAGFDHADLSLPGTALPAARETPEGGAAPVTTEDDARQMRTLHGGMAGAIGALVAGGAVAASGGALAPAAAAAVAAGLGGAALAEVAENTLGAAADYNNQKQAAAAGGLVLAARVISPERRGVAEQVMRAAGATEIAVVRRDEHVIDSSRWTG